MKRSLLCMTAALLLCGAAFAQTNYWGNDPDSHAQPSNTPIVASVTVDDEAVTVTDDMRLGAFVGDELRGIAAPHTDGKFWIQVFYTAATDNITFKFYDGTDEYATCATTLAGSDEGYGTPSTPETLNFTTAPQTITQTTTFEQGWTWWSTPIEMNGVDGLTMLENALGSNGTIIKGKTTSATYLPALNRWVGNCPITNEASYKINVSSECSATMNGAVADPSQHPITLVPGWNWIGYPVSQQQVISAAINNEFQPTAGDIIKNQSTQAVYISSILGWTPSTFTLTPGSGYLYYSKATEDRTLYFTNNRNSYLEVVDEKMHWEANTHEAEGNLGIFAQVYVNGEMQRNEDIEIGAFVNGQCRGAARLIYLEPIDAYYLIMTVTGDEGDQIDFRLFDNRSRTTNNNCSTYLTYEDNAIIGNPKTPFSIHFGEKSEISMQASMMKVFPNPARKDQPFTLNIPEDESISELILSNLTGNVVSREVGNVISQHHGLPVSGVYFIKVICKTGNIYYGKVIVE